MKKIITLTLCVAMLCMMSLSAFAGTITSITENNTDSGNVMAQYVLAGGTPTYSVDIEWGSMAFTYTVPQVWDEENHEWDPDTANAEWAPVAVEEGETAANAIIVTNHSSTSINASVSFAAEEAYNTVTGSFGEEGANSANLNTAAEHTFELTLGGSIANTVTTSTKVGTVTVTIGAAA